MEFKNYTLIEDSTTSIFPGTLQPGDYNVEVVLETNRVEVGCDEVEYEVLLDYSLSAAPSNQPSESSEPSISIQPSSTTYMPTAATEFPTTYMPSVRKLNLLHSLVFCVSHNLLIFQLNPTLMPVPSESSSMPSTSSSPSVRSLFRLSEDNCLLRLSHIFFYSALTGSYLYSNL